MAIGVSACVQYNPMSTIVLNIQHLKFKIQHRYGMEYSFRDIEKKWKEIWNETNAYKVSDDLSKPKCYILDMFPYPSGAGLHVGHPLGYIASDIYARYKRLKGFNVLHPIGFDAFGLPAEQFAIETGQHPAITTRQNIEVFKKQLNNIGFSFDWSREVNTSDPAYYKWTQWIFLQIYDSWFNRSKQKAERISELMEIFSKEGNINHICPGDEQLVFNADEWSAFNEERREDVLMQYRLAYLAYTEVNWCEALGTVLANDEVINGRSYRGGFPVVKRKMRQWSLRITEYAERLLKGLDEIDFSVSMKEIQRNWIGKSEGAEIDFEIEGTTRQLKVYTTRPDTIFGVDFMVVAPEHELIGQITTAEHRQAVEDYKAYVQSRSELDRMAETKKITGAFTGAYAVNPFNGKQIPVWISEYVLIGYGTGAIMGVPSGDQRDFLFAKHFNIPITNIIGEHFNGEEANPTKDAILENSDFITGMPMRKAIEVVADAVEKRGIGKRRINYKMRDAGWSRQRYWGEPFPVKYSNGHPYALKEDELPLVLPPLDEFKSSGSGEGPLANVPEWVEAGYDTNTMPTHAGAAWYFLRYMDPHNETAFAGKDKLDYWSQVDVYVGGSEHAVAHLLYARLWIKVLHDLGYLNFDEPFKKLINQGKITGDSRFVYRIKDSHTFVSAGLKDKYETDHLHVDVNIVDGFELNTEAFKKWKPDFSNAEFILEDGKYICGGAIEKMSKSYYNVVNPDWIVEKYGADTFRMYEMFLGPLEQDKPWDTKGIEGVHRFLKKLWRLFFDEMKGKVWNDEQPTEAELKVLHRTIRKVEEDIERFSFNTAVSAFMMCVNDLSDLKCHKKAILEQLLILLAPYAPHITEELWHAVGNTSSILVAQFPVFEEKYLVESSKNYPVSINGKVRTQIDISLQASQEEVEQIVKEHEVIRKWLEGKQPKKVIYVKGRMVNVVV
jgi:leucyl-tRNA synthetase